MRESPDRRNGRGPSAVLHLCTDSAVGHYLTITFVDQPDGSVPSEETCASTCEAVGAEGEPLRPEAVETVMPRPSTSFVADTRPEVVNVPVAEGVTVIPGSALMSKDLPSIVSRMSANHGAEEPE